MDELGSDKRINTKIPEIIDKLKRESDELKDKKIQVVKSQNYEQAAKLRDEERKLLAKLEGEKNKWLEKQKDNKIPVTVNDVYEIISAVVLVVF